MTRTKIIAIIVAVFLVAPGAATATKALTGKDIRNGSIAERDLNKKVKRKLNATAQGPEGPQGVQGEPGEHGFDGDDGIDGESGEQGEPGFDGEPGDRGPEGPRGPRGLEGDRGPRGDIGDRGPQGERGQAGQDGVSGLQYTQGVIASYVNEPGPYTVRARCLNGQKPIGGGYAITQGDIRVVGSYPEPVGPNEAWAFDIVAGAGSASITVTAVCITAR